MTQPYVGDMLTRSLRAETPDFDKLPVINQLELRVRKMRSVVSGLDDTIRSGKASEARTARAAHGEATEYLEILEGRIEELRENEAREAKADEARARFGGSSPTGETGPAWHHTGGGETYHRGNTSPSFFRDLLNAQRGDADAADRLRRNNQEVGGVESRALGNTGGTGGSGGEFAPPAWLIDEFVALARPGRVTADLFHHEDMPSGVSSVNIPKVMTGTATAIQSTQNTALAETDITTGSLSSSITTIGGKQVVSQQLLDQSPGQIDRIVLEDLAADYARQVGTQVLTGSGTSGQLKGYLTATSTNNQTWTQATPTAGLFYSQLAKLQGAIYASLYAAPDAVVMHPRRWAWFASYTDSSGRPLVVPDAGAYNRTAALGANAPAGHVGSVLGMDVYTDPNIPVTLGAGTNQDVVLMFRRDDVWLWESPLRAEAFREPAADSLGVLFRIYAYSAMIPDRRPAALGQIQGTGLVTPTFAG